MKIIISERQLRQIIESKKNIKAYKIMVDELGLKNASEQLGIPVNKLIEMGVVEKIDADINLINTPINTLGAVKKAMIDLNFGGYRNPMEDLGELEYVKGNLDLSFNTKIKSLNNLKKVDGYLDLEKSSIETLSGLTSVKLFLNLTDCENLTSLGNLNKVGRNLNLINVPITSLDNLKYVGSTLRLINCKNLTSLGKLEYVGGYLSLKGTPLAETMTKEEIADKLKMDKKNIYL